MSSHVKESCQAYDKDNWSNGKQENTQIEHVLQGFNSQYCHSRTQDNNKGAEVGKESTLICHPGAVYRQPVAGNEIFLYFFYLFTFPQNLSRPYSLLLDQ